MINKDLSPPLKWAGGKRWLVPYLKPNWQPYSDNRLVELFCGGLAIALGLMPERALLNDINPHLINFYQQLQQGLDVQLNEKHHDETVFYASRDEFNALIRHRKADTPRAAELFYYLNRTGFNGLCRFNSEGFFNVPFGRYKTINYMNTAEFSPYAEVLSQWEFQQGDFNEVALQPNDFVYADPPYDVEFTKYSKEDFTWVEQVKLAELLVEHPGPVVASNQATPRITELYRSLGFDVYLYDAPRRISRTGDRTPAEEIVAVRNFNWVKHAEQLSLF